MADWIELTADPDTWPKPETVVMGTQLGWQGPMCVRHGKSQTYHRPPGHLHIFHTTPGEDPCHITWWRPLMDCDFPPAAKMMMEQVNA